MVVFGHKPGLQNGNFDLVHDGHNLKKISLKIKKKFIFCITLFLKDALYFLYVSCILAGPEVKNSSGRLLILEQPLK